MNSSTTLLLIALVAGVDNERGVAVRIDPHDSIENLFDMLAQALVDVFLPYDFAAAYLLVHTTNGVGLRCSDPDCIALAKGDPIIMARYITPAARLDPTKTVAHYFGTHVESNRVHIVLEWTAASRAVYDKEVTLSKVMAAPRVATTLNARVSKPPAPQVAVRAQATRTSPSLWTSVVSWASGSVASWPCVSRHNNESGVDSARKNDADRSKKTM